MEMLLASILCRSVMLILKKKRNEASQNSDMAANTAQKMKFSIKDSFKCNGFDHIY